MIFYFSATGNSRWVAQQLAEKLGDRVVDIARCDTAPDLAGEKLAGFVFPVYAWGVPEIVADFAAGITGRADFTFRVCTCGDQAGKAMKVFDGIYHADSLYSVVMPSNYIIGADLESSRSIAGKLKAAAERTELIASQIAVGKKVYDVHEGPAAGFKTAVISKGFAGFARRTKPFYVTDRCTGCGLCEKLCPRHTIKLTDGRPVWGTKCYQCTACLNMCPEQAIQYGRSTAGRKRYRLSDWSRYLPGSAD